MKEVLVVGSGASGVHFALSLLKKGYKVTMLDAGQGRPEPVNPSDTFVEMKSRLQDPARYFLGNNYEAVVYPGSETDYYTKYYGTPPSKNHVFSKPNGFSYEADGIVPLLSFAQGGLAEAWTGGAYALNNEELRDYPFDYEDIAPHYGEVARRIGLIGVDDDLAKFYPLHDNLIDPLRLDKHSQLLVDKYNSQKEQLTKKHKIYLGRSRVTTLSHDTAERNGCNYCGRCLWGCPSESLYTPSITLRECLTYPNFNYVPFVFVTHFKYDANGRVTGMVAASLHDHQSQVFTADRYVLAAGAMSSSKIFMDSVHRQTGEVIKLSGLMDNRQVLIPFLNLQMLGDSYDPESYQYHQLAIGLEAEDPTKYLHGQITTLKSASVHPIIQNVPFDLRTSTFIFKNVRAGLGVVNLNFYDYRRETNYVTLQTNGNGDGYTKLHINYEPAEGEGERITKAVKKVKRFLWGLRCVVPPGMVHVRPMGASVHYTGTIPMTEHESPLTASKYCRSHDFENLYMVDGTTIPYLPAKNITFTLMANAVRVAETAF